MKIHANGTIEGSPAELAEYAKLTAVQQHPFKVIDPILPKTTGTDAGKYPGKGTVYTKPFDPLEPLVRYAEMLCGGYDVRGPLIK